MLIHGPRQSGKTTLAQTVGTARGCSYFSFDDAVTLAAAISDTVGLCETLPPARSSTKRLLRVVPNWVATMNRAVDEGAPRD